MKFHLFFVIAITLLNLTGCQNMTTPLTDSQVNDSVRLAMSYPASSFKLNDPDEYYKKACTRALSKMEIFLSENNISACLSGWGAVIRGEQQARQQAQRQARLEAQQAKRAKFNHRVAEILAGRASINTIQEAVAIYHAADGASLLQQPLLRPDGLNYVVSGAIDSSDSLNSDHITLSSEGSTAIGGEIVSIPIYARIILGSVKMPPGARIGSYICIVGTYTSNSEYMTLEAGKIMPVFTAKYIKLGC